MVALTGDYELTFAFTLNTGTLRERVINSTRKLNGGEWHKIWIDYNDYHVRFMVNTNVDMVDLLPEEQFGPFEVSCSLLLGKHSKVPQIIHYREACSLEEQQLIYSRKHQSNKVLLDALEVWLSMEKFSTYTATCQYIFLKLSRIVSLHAYPIPVRMELNVKNYGRTSSVSVKIHGHM